jgi:hypothetical protein
MYEDGERDILQGKKSTNKHFIRGDKQEAFKHSGDDSFPVMEVWSTSLFYDHESWYKGWMS